ncbi:MAG: flagellar filament outer layer protein FlaA [Spirochaetota bacterium]
MRHRRSHSVLAVMVAVVLVAGAATQQAHSKIETNVPQDVSEKELIARVVEDFEQQKDWKLESNPKRNPDEKKNPVPVLEMKYITGAPSSLEPEKWSPDKKGMEAKQCLGMHFRFKYPGNNSVHLLPPPEVRWDDPTKAVTTFDSGLQKEVQERALQLPGRARAISIWAHGRGNAYKLEVWVKDFQGDVHILPMGSLDFVGWRPMKAEVPEYIPQEVNSYPQTKVTKIMRFVIRSDPEAIVEDVYLFFDQLKVLTDTFEVNFDGQNLHKAFEGGNDTGQ